jgi:amino acid adenylation domain-containing protein
MHERSGAATAVGALNLQTGGGRTGRTAPSADAGPVEVGGPGDPGPAAPMRRQAVQHLVADWAKRQPNACAVRDPSTNQALTYRELWQQAGWVATRLIGHGVGRGDLVAVALDRSIELVVALLGIVRAGAAYMPLDTHAPTERLAAILREAGTDLVVCASSQPSAHDTPVGRERWLHLQPGLRRVPVPTSAPADGDPPPEAVVGGNDPIYVAYTSGSTGGPKGVVVPHRAVIRLAVEANYCTILPGDRVANASNPAFDATTFEIWSTLTSGGTIVVFPSVTDLTVDEWATLVRDEDITTMFLTTSLFHMVARERPQAFRSLHNLVVGGEQLEAAAVRRVLATDPPRRLVNGYGPTETTTFSTFFECTAESMADVERIPIGFALQNTRLHVLDEHLRPVAPGDPGELCIGGPGVATGYLHRPELTAEKFLPEPSASERPASSMYRTGDVVRQLPSGALELLGRRDRQIKLRGFRIELEEIERATVATGLVDVAFVEKVGEGPSATLIGFVLPATSVRTAAEDLPSALSEGLATRLPDYMVPNRWFVLPGLPFGPTGKVDRTQLLALLAQAPGRREDTGPPTNCTNGAADAETGSAAEPVTTRLQRIWQDVLGIAKVRATDNFIDLGGNSILAIQMASRAREQLAVEVEPTDVLLAGTLGDLAAQIRPAHSVGLNGSTHDRDRSIL